MYPHRVFNLEPAGTFGMYPICYRRVSGRYFQPEPAMYSRCFRWFPGPLAPSDSREGSSPKENQEVLGSLIRLSNVLKGMYSPSQGSNGATTSLGWMTVGSYWTSSRSPLFFVSMPKRKFHFQLQGARELHVTEQRWLRSP